VDATQLLVLTIYLITNTLRPASYTIPEDETIRTSTVSFQSDKLIATLLVKKFLAFYETRGFITVFIKTTQRTLS
jgi:hypothetical protein